ncbi:uncharacterized protein MELLADRAFT_124551 [Melampsora larici-populina 98AG31]|uniref:Secreted protein n=1 Tax=Melampsora larici-populina (strain 98AG31 / pathotype 3-4-7) TaxID=747676 RepID=F4RGU7_MELLP|nr:uncharacterized protein MELLADRAFT_124551 [Melampsora larici-populina 98AG31]EGG08333.1 secreted protein [Melampsora larici-populina 98AG31]
MFVKKMYFDVFAFLIALHSTAGQQEETSTQHLATRQFNFQRGLFSYSTFGLPVYNNNPLYQFNNNYFIYNNGVQISVPSNVFPTGFRFNIAPQYPNGLVGLAPLGRYYQQFPMFRHGNVFGYNRGGQFIPLPTTYNFLQKRSTSDDLSSPEKEFVA